MTYFPDLSPYEYDLPMKIPSVLTVGWIEEGHVFNRKKPNDDFLEALDWCCRNRPVNLMRGIHHCQFCDYFENTVRKEVILGSAEIWIPDKDKVYAAPNLIIHYVEIHEYSPPNDFVNAVMEFYKNKPSTNSLYENIVDKAYAEYR